MFFLFFNCFGKVTWLIGRFFGNSKESSLKSCKGGVFTDGPHGSVKWIFFMWRYLEPQTFGISMEKSEEIEPPIVVCDYLRNDCSIYVGQFPEVLENCTPPKTNMELENHPFEKENNLPNLSCGIQHVSFRGCKSFFQWWIPMLHRAAL